METPTKAPITVASGDGIGPEIMQAALFVLEEAGAQLEIERIEVGEKVFQRGLKVGIEPSAWESLRRTKVFYKAPITTPQGGGFQSLNVTIRKALGLYANVRPCVSYHPFISTLHPKMDLVIVRENEEDTYGGVEYRVSDDMCESLKLISRPGCERVIRYAFEYAKQHNRKKISCLTKDNIMKFTDGLFHRTFERIAAEYPDFETEHWIIDIGTARVANTPEAFDVVVTPNLYGDILSDVTAEISGSVGLAGSANIGEHCAMFEAVHGSAPSQAGQNSANPSGILLAGVMMLVHLGQAEAAARLHNALLRTIEEGVHTFDVFKEGQSRHKVGTREFARAVVDRLGQAPQLLKPVAYQPQRTKVERRPEVIEAAQKVQEGADIYLHWKGGDAAQLATALQRCEFDGVQLQGIFNRGVRVWPTGFPETFCTDSWCCRFMMSIPGRPMTHDQIAELLARIAAEHLDFVEMHSLSTFDKQKGYTGDQI